MKEEDNRLLDVYREDGEFLGIFESLYANTVLCMNEETIDNVAIGETLKVTDRRTKAVHRVRILNNFYWGRYTLHLEVLEELEPPSTFQLSLFNDL